MSKRVEINSTIIQKKGLDSTEMDGEIVMMNISVGKYYGFNSVGSRIWQLAEHPSTISSIIDTLPKEFNVDSKTCEEMVLKFVNELNAEDLIDVI